MEQKYGRSRRRKKQNISTDQLFVRTIRRAICSMLLCTACLISSTWAWFVSTSESHVSVIRLGETNVTVSQEFSTFARRSSIRDLGDGEVLMPAGEYIITVEPKTGTAPMYCLVELEAEYSGRELAEEAVDIFNADMEEEWVSVYASDSNAIRIVDEDELDTFIEEFEEDNEETEYEVLPLEVVTNGIYRVDWESGEERTFHLELSQDALVRMEVFWLTEDEAEDDYPTLDELTGWKYVIVYSEESENALKSTMAVETSEAAETTTGAETMAGDESMTSAGAMPDAETTADADVRDESLEAESVIQKTEETVKETQTAETESTKVPTAAAKTTAAIETTEAEPTVVEDASTEADTSKAEMTEPESAEAAAESSQEPSEEERTQEIEITPLMSTEEIESMDESSSSEE